LKRQSPPKAGLFLEIFSLLLLFIEIGQKDYQIHSVDELLLSFCLLNEPKKIGQQRAIK